MYLFKKIKFNNALKAIYIQYMYCFKKIFQTYEKNIAVVFSTKMAQINKTYIFIIKALP